MKFKTTLASLAAASFVIAQPAAAASALPADRLASPTGDAEGAAAGGLLWVALAFAALIAIGEVTDLINVFGDDDEPASP